MKQSMRLVKLCRRIRGADYARRRTPPGSLWNAVVAVVTIGATSTLAFGQADPCAEHKAGVPTVRASSEGMAGSSGDFIVNFDGSGDKDALTRKAIRLRVTNLSDGKTSDISVEGLKAGTLHAVAAGAYTLEVLDSGTSRKIAPDRKVEIPDKGGSITVHLGGAENYYRLGENLIPFEGNKATVTILFPTVVESDQADGSLEKKLVQYLLQQKVSLAKQKWQPYGTMVDDKKTLVKASEWELQLTDSKDSVRAVQALREILAKEGVRATVALPIAPRADTGVFNNLRYIAAFDSAEQAKQLRVLYGPGSRIVFLRELDSINHLWLIDIGSGETVLDAENVVACWRDKGWVKTVEPDLVFRVPPQSLAGDWPNDPMYWGAQRAKQHEWHKVRTAWELLAGLPGARGGSVASSKVVVASLDSGVLPLDREVKCEVDDGSPQLSDCYSMSSGLDCSNAGYALPPMSAGFPLCMRETHGMAIFGIISACTNNRNGHRMIDGEVAAVAPGARHIAAQKPASFSVTAFGDALLWLAGLQPECAPTPTDGCFWRRPVAGARIINCSFEIPISTMPTYWSRSVLPRLEKDGASRQGTLVVFAAGNGKRQLSGTETLGDARLLTVGNCRRADVPGSSAKFSLSDQTNYGKPIALCAAGDNSDTSFMYQAYGCDTPCSCDLGLVTQSIVNGTSAAAAHVTGVGALVLTANPKLRPAELACILRETANAKVVDARADVPMASGAGIEHIDCRFSGSGRSQCYGSGLLDASAAVRAALGRAGPGRNCVNRIE